jgi:hypothetical protein
MDSVALRQVRSEASYVRFVMDSVALRQVRSEASYVRFVMDSVALRQVSLRELEFSPTIVTVELLHTYNSFILYPQYGLSTDSVSLRTLKL